VHASRVALLPSDPSSSRAGRLGFDWDAGCVLGGEKTLVVVTDGRLVVVGPLSEAAAAQPLMVAAAMKVAIVLTTFLRTRGLRDSTQAMRARLERHAASARAAGRPDVLLSAPGLGGFRHYAPVAPVSGTMCQSSGTVRQFPAVTGRYRAAGKATGGRHRARHGGTIAVG